MKRSRIRAGIGGLAVLSATAVGAVALVLSLSGRDAPEPPPLTRGIAPVTRGIAPVGGAVAQTYSAYCETPTGVCVLPSAQQIGTTCQCPDGSNGRVIP